MFLDSLAGFFRNSIIFLETEANIIMPDENAQDMGINVEEMVNQAQTNLSADAPFSGLILGMCILLGVVCIALTILILMQKKRASGIGASLGGGSGDTYWGKNKGKSVEGALEKYTAIGGTAFLLIALLINVLS